ncbi:membrane protein [Heyndrickxia sporothermodurans]|nr:membrane protein [Heyndrickxia sporothermodurans]
MTDYHKKKILIIGGTGTLGQRLVKELLSFSPAVIRVFSRDEYKQFEMQQEYQGYKNIRFLIGDVRDFQRVLRAMEDIDYVFHLAAMKHVPACEYNPFEAVQTNVIGTQNVIQAALESGVEKVLFTSTDKAIAPSNTYGASKLMAERLISATQHQKGSKKTIFASVRFGNVMGSRGSVIPLFKKQLLKGEPLTITDPNMLRYMMTPSQAISLILKANDMSKGGEVFVLKMPLIKLSDLVQVLTDFYKKVHYIENVDVKYIGLRPGEKRYEELITDDEALGALETDDMYIILPAYGFKDQNYLIPTSIIHEKPFPNESDVISKETLKFWLKREELLF